ncbi:MAG: hypothetical protein ABSG67_10780 [Thermoguttaceae bacterium]|jgi:hypothetical protein
MYKALVFKELRETIGIAIIAILAYLAGIANLIGYTVLPFGMVRAFPEPIQGAIPFQEREFFGWFMLVSVVFCLALGLRQTVGESRGGTWMFLLHRPISLRKLICIKMAVGVGLYFVVSAMAILIYAAWAATPGTHASPFYWWMTSLTWKVWFLIFPCYFGAFLSGIRPGRWIGTRLLPVPAVCIAISFLAYVVFELKLFSWWFLVIFAFPLLCAFLFGEIMFVARTRDFS